VCSFVEGWLREGGEDGEGQKSEKGDVHLVLAVLTRG
jgi:hypothetical protein